MSSELASDGDARPPVHPRLFLQGVLRQPQLRSVHQEAASQDPAVHAVRSVVSLRRPLRRDVGGAPERMSHAPIGRLLPQPTETPQDLRRLPDLYDTASTDGRSEMCVDADGHMPESRVASDKISPGNNGEHGTVVTDVTQLPRHPPDARPTCCRSFAAVI